MPLYLHACTNPDCEAYDRPVEHYFPTTAAQPPQCEYCSGPTERRIGQSAFLWGHDLSFYNDKNKEDAHLDAHWVYEKNTPDGKPHAVRIENLQQQREFCRREGLRIPGDVNPNARISSDGKSWETAGMPGQWV